MRNVSAIIKDIEGYVPVNDDWSALDTLIVEACSTNDQKVIKPLLGLLERNQNHDGHGVFWSIVHGLEAVGNYESALLTSVLSKPHEMSLLMLNRMLNAGMQTIDGNSIVEVFKKIAANTEFSITIREDAKDFLAYQSENT